MVFVRNITDRKKAEENLNITLKELERSNKELEQFAYVSSHDLQEPLRMVTSYVQLFSNKFRNRIDSKADEYLDFIVAGTRRMQSLIKALLIIARVSSKARPFEQTDFKGTFSIKDNGIGIDPEYSDKIFIIFQRLHARDEYSGTGIGLTICKKIVERHRGKIWVKSVPGKGSTFYFTILNNLNSQS